MLELEHVKIYVGEKGHICISQSDGHLGEDDQTVCFHTLQAKIIAYAIMECVNSPLNINAKSNAF